MALCVWAWMHLLSQLQWGLWFCLPSFLCYVVCFSLLHLWAEGSGSHLGDLAAFFVSLWSVWPLWLLLAYMCLCLYVMFIGVLGLGHDVPITQVGGAPLPPSSCRIPSAPTSLPTLVPHVVKGWGWGC